MRISLAAISMSLPEAALSLRASAGSLRFGGPITHVYNPLDYAWESHRTYLETYGKGRKRILFLGMNPGPHGMAQTGVPFGEVAAVRDWMKIERAVGKPKAEHPKRPVLGFQCPQSEVSGRRLWGLFAQRYGEASAFFVDHFVVNYCPLVFMEESGRNFTPEKLPAAEAAPLTRVCDEHLRRVVKVLEPEWLIGVGGFAEQRLQACFGEKSPTQGPWRIGQILHPSPASPAANRDWPGKATRQLEDLGVW
jgi:single-strand selective monofunctional uracil DNA glycosylase